LYEQILLHIIIRAFKSGYNVLAPGNTPLELEWRRACLDLLRNHDDEVPRALYPALFAETELRRPWPDPPDDDEPSSLALVA